MERFTFRTVSGTAVLYLGDSSEWAIISGRNNHEYKISGDAAERLAAYEDTGLEPEEIYEVRFLIAAQRDPQKLARLRELVLADQDGRLHITPAFVWHNGDSGLHEVPYKPWMAQWIATGTKFWLTREEAEAALKGGESDA